MRSDTATVRRVRLVITLSVAGAVTVMLGVLLMIAGTAARLFTSHPVSHLTGIGLGVAAAGMVFGLIVLVAFASTRPAARQQQTRSLRSPHPSHRHGDARRRASRAGGSRGGDGQQGRGTSARPRNQQVLNPTTIYTPGGLIGAPRDARASGAAGTMGTTANQESGGSQNWGGQGTPGGPRAAGAPGASGTPGAGRPGGERQDRPSRGRAGAPPPRPAYPPGTAYPQGTAYPPGMSPGPGYGQGPNRMPYAQDDRRPPPRSGGSMPPRGARTMPPRDPMGPGGPAGPSGPMPPRDAMRQGSARTMPHREPVQPGTYGQNSRGDGAWHVPGPGQAKGAQGAQGVQAGPGTPWAGHPAPSGFAPPPAGPGQGPGRVGQPGHAGPRDPSGFADGGYAYVIRAEDYPVPPLSPARQGRPPNATAPADAAKAKPTGEDQNVYVYREAEAEARADGGAQAGPAEPDESDAAFWYGRREETSPPAEAEYRGFFEPLVPSAAPSPGPAASDESAGRATQDAVGLAGRADRPEPEESAHAQARSLEQLKDFYLTAEAIGEENVDKHFDQLLTQQRELISEYFRQSAAKLGGAPASGPVGPVGPASGRKPPEPPDPIAGEPGRDRAAQVGPGEAVVAEKPRA